MAQLAHSDMLDIDESFFFFFSMIPESTFRDARLFDALLADQGRSDRCGGREATDRTRRIDFCPGSVGSRRSGHLGRYRQSRVLEAKNTVRESLLWVKSPHCSQ